MSELPESFATVPKVDEAAPGAIGAKTVYVADATKDGFVSRYDAGQHALLRAGGRRLELTTTATYDGEVEAPGSYLEPSDWEALPAATDPKIRRYRRRDSLRKVATGAGLLVLMPVLIGLAAAGLAVWFGLAADEPTSAASVAGSGQRLVSWVAAPAAGLDGSEGPKRLTAVREQIVRRQRIADQCLRQLGGAGGPVDSAGGVVCTAKSPTWWRDRDHAAYVTLAAGVFTALFAAFGLRNKFGFGRSPSA